MSNSFTIAQLKTKEAPLHKQVVDYIKWQYKDVIFHTDFAAGCKMTMGQAVKNKGLQSGKSWPDLFIAEPRNGYHGLFIEIKSGVDKVYKKDLTFKKDEHIEDQAAMLARLTARGYKAVFGCGFEHCVGVINEYLKPAYGITIKEV